MAAGSMADVYTDFCRQQQIETNAYVLDVLQNTTFTEYVSGQTTDVKRRVGLLAKSRTKCCLQVLQRKSEIVWRKS